MLVLQIALGIVLAVVILMLLPVLLRAILPLIAYALIAAMFLGAIAAAVWFFGNIKPIQPHEWPVVLVGAILVGCYAAVYYYAPVDENGEGKIGVLEIVISLALLAIGGLLMLGLKH